MNTKVLTATVTILFVLALVAATVLAAIHLPQVAIYVPVIAVGLALALQKYIASFFSYFFITFTKVYEIGDRIRVGNVKGDVLKVGLLHTTLAEVGEDEKLGGEVTGRLLYVPNLIILDQPVLNYSQDYSVKNDKISSDYVFDEVRIPISNDSIVPVAVEVLDSILKEQDEVYVREAAQKYGDNYPKFLGEALNRPRVVVYLEPQRIWIKGKYVTPLKQRNEMRTKIVLLFLEEASTNSEIKIA